jgi:cytochrome P450
LTKLPFCRSDPAFTHATQFSIDKIQERLAFDAAGINNQSIHDQKNFLDTFIRGQRSLSGGYNQNRLVCQLLINVVAGSDTTATILTAAVYFVLKHPRVLETLREELDRENLDTPVAFDRAQKLPYLSAIIDETMRLQPAVGLALERLVPEGGLTLPDGRVIPKGTIVGVNPYVVHRNEDVFGQKPDAFEPERWLRRETENEVAFEQRLGRMMRCNLTFGSGKRICIGRHVSSLEIYKMIATLFYLYDVRIYALTEYSKVYFLTSPDLSDRPQAEL